MSDSSVTDYESDHNQPGPSAPKKRKVYKQLFKKEWAKLPGFYWVESSKKGSSYAWYND